MISAWGVDHGEPVSKARKRRPATGRETAGMYAGAIGGIVGGAALGTRAPAAARGARAAAQTGRSGYKMLRSVGVNRAGAAGSSARLGGTAYRRTARKTPSSLGGLVAGYAGGLGAYATGVSAYQNKKNVTLM